MSKNLFAERRKLKKESNRRRNDDNKNRCSNNSCSNYASLKLGTCKMCRDKCPECEGWKKSIKTYPDWEESAPIHCIESDNKCDQRISDYVDDYREFCYICRPKCVECNSTSIGIGYLNKLGYYKCKDCIEKCYECKKQYSNNCNCYSESLR